MSWYLWFQGWPVMKGGPGSGHHGHKGRAGQRGGSLPSKGMGAYPLSAPVGDIGTAGNKKVDRWMNEGLPTEREGIMLVPKWNAATPEDRAALKAKVVRDLAAATGVTEQEAADFVRQWAESSNDDDMRSLAIQRDAAREFGVKTSEFTQGKIDRVMEQRENFAITRYTGVGGEHVIDYPSNFKPLMESDKQRAVLRAMYNETQAELKARGIEEVRVYRGVRMEKAEYAALKGQDLRDVGISTNAIESWSVSQGVGDGFAAAAVREGKRGLTFSTVVPARRILSMPATGFGCLREGEIVVLGGVDGDRAEVVSIW